MRVRVLLRAILSVVLILLSLPLWLATVISASAIASNFNAAYYLVGPCLLTLVLAGSLLGLGLISFPKQSSEQTDDNSPG